MFSQISLKSKLIFMLLGIALLCISIIGYQGLYNGKKALMSRIYSQLTSVRESKRAQIKAWLKEMQAHAQALAIDHSVITATKEFTSAYHRLKDKTLPPQQLSDLKQFYTDQFIPQLAEKLKLSPELEHFFPKDSRVQYLQYHYLDTKNTQAKALNSSPDKSYYAGVHQYYHPVFRSILDIYGIEDMFLVDIKTGDIVYSAMKNVDFALNLYSGGLSASNLGRLAQTIDKSQGPGVVSISDFDFYKPAFGRPSAFMGTTIFDDNDEAIGILIIRLPLDSLNDVMTGMKAWRQQGLGETGEAFLVGSDFLMRSNARLLCHSKNCYAKDLAKKHLLDKVTADKICQLKTSVLLQKVTNPAVKKALRGESGTQIVRSYSGEKALVAYAPLLIQNLSWAIIAEIDLNEANMPIAEFQKELGISAVIIASIVTLIAMFLAGLFTRPIEALLTGARQLLKGDTSIAIPSNRKDEYGQLAQAFNQTVQFLTEKEAIIQAQEKQYQGLLNNIFPAKIVDKYNANQQQNFSEKINNVTVLQTSLTGFHDYSNTASAEAAVKLLHKLITEIDQLAEKHGIEKIKTIGTSYLAACGLTTARLNHAQRSVNFSLDLLQLIKQFNRNNATHFSIRIGLHSGDVLMGVVGKNKVSFDVWGTPVIQASRIRYAVAENSIALTRSVYKNLSDQSLFTTQETVKTKAMGDIKIYIYSEKTNLSNTEES